MTGERTPIKRTWFLRWADLGALFAWLLVIIGVFWALGEAVTRIDPIVEADHAVARRLERGRTDSFDALAVWGAGLSDTIVKIVATAVIGGLMLAVWRRWLDPLVVVVALVFEASAFIVVTFLVGRPRPPVEQLQHSPVDTSFPSGHVAAAAAYLAIAVVINWRVRRPLLRALVWAVPVIVTLIVALARLYQGMHFLSDVVAGVVLGVVSVVIALRILTASHRASAQTEAASGGFDEAPGAAPPIVSHEGRAGSLGPEVGVDGERLHPSPAHATFDHQSVR